MKPLLLLWNFLAAGGLFFLNALLGRLQYGLRGTLFSYGKFNFSSAEEMDFSGNFFQKLVNPAVYLAIVAAAAQRLGFAAFLQSLWLLPPLFWVWRAAYMVFKNVFPFLNLRYEALSCVLSLALGEGTYFFLLRPLVEAGEPLWIARTELRDALWFAILAYVLKVAWEVMRTGFAGSSLYPIERRYDLIFRRYDRFQRRYGALIRDRLLEVCRGRLAQPLAEQLGCLVYAVMIYEDYNRPPLMRAAEYCAKFFLRRRPMTLGVMQVRSVRRISSRESILLAIDRLSAPFLAGAPDPVDRAIEAYNQGGEYFDEVSSIYRALCDRLCTVSEI